jgi:hypothetical protein
VGKPGDRCGKPKHRWEENFKWILKKEDEISWTGLIWLRRGKSEKGGAVLVQ